ncbi:hypothetical protein pipiens_012601 [Culex pipiens pipiens]|uniref:Uncharacterized protein n=1 Tax=Culex pipiens pipiens TaxID=38569 RepID=A0ABD1D1N4_CULPP
MAAQCYCFENQIRDRLEKFSGYRCFERCFRQAKSFRLCCTCTCISLTWSKRIHETQRPEELAANGQYHPVHRQHLILNE